MSEFTSFSNTYDSLGEAYMVIRDRENSIWIYEESLKIDPENFNAEDQVERIKFPIRFVES
ncbi:MAG: hypothetical protein MK105_00350 [Crocinitomicaceae bacterium]|nr:hypothetical protein [Crocinitomicaceae bacterium]